MNSSMKSQVLDEDAFGNPLKSYGYCKLDGQEAQGFFSTIVTLVFISIVAGDFDIVILFMYDDPCIHSFVHPYEIFYAY